MLSQSQAQIGFNWAEPYLSRDKVKQSLMEPGPNRDKINFVCPVFIFLSYEECTILQAFRLRRDPYKYHPKVWYSRIRSGQP